MDVVWSVELGLRALKSDKDASGFHRRDRLPTPQILGRLL